MDEDREFEEILRRLAGPVDRVGVWASIEGRARTEGGLEEGRPVTSGAAGQAADDQSSFPMKPVAPKRRGLRVAMVASVAVVFLAAVTIGIVEAVGHLG